MDTIWAFPLSRTLILLFLFHLPHLFKKKTTYGTSESLLVCKHQESQSNLGWKWPRKDKSSSLLEASLVVSGYSGLRPGEFWVTKFYSMKYADPWPLVQGLITLKMKRLSLIYKVNHVAICVCCLLPCHWAPLGWVHLCLLAVVESCWIHHH